MALYGGPFQVPVTNWTDDYFISQTRPRYAAVKESPCFWFNTTQMYVSFTSQWEVILAALPDFSPWIVTQGSGTLQSCNSTISKFFTSATWMREGCGKFRLLHTRVVIIIFIFQMRRHVYCPRLVSGRFQTNITAPTLLSTIYFFATRDILSMLMLPVLIHSFIVSC